MDTLPIFKLNIELSVKSADFLEHWWWNWANLKYRLYLYVFLWDSAEDVDFEFEDEGGRGQIAEDYLY